MVKFKKAFGLIEILIGTFIILISTIGILTTIIFSRSLLARESRTIMTFEFANSVMEDLVFDSKLTDLRLSIPQGAAASGPIVINPADFPANDAFWQGSSLAASYVVSWYQIDPAIPVDVNDQDTLIAKRIDLTISWIETAQKVQIPRAITLSSVIY